MRRTIATIAITAYAIATLSISAAALTVYDRQELSHVNALADQNPGFESGTVKWSGSPALTINSNAASQFIPGSKQFAVWDSTSSDQEVCSALEKVPESGNCAVSLTYKVPSGTATHKIVAKDGSKDLAVEDVFSSTAAWRHDVEFPCAAAASNQARVCLRSVASNEPAIQLDGGYAGQSRTVGQCGVDTPWVPYTPVITGLGTGSATITGMWRGTGDSIEASFIMNMTSNGSGASAVEISIPSQFTMNASKFLSGGGPRGAAFSQATTILTCGGNSFSNKIVLATNSGAATGSALVNGNIVRCSVNIPVNERTASQCVTPEQQRTPKITRYTSGSGTHTTTQGATYMVVKFCGGGGGGGGSGTSTSGGAGGAGGTTTFGTSLLSAPGGSGGAATGGGLAAGGAGGAGPTINSPAEIVEVISGGNGTDGAYEGSGSSGTDGYVAGGRGGSGRRGGAGAGTIAAVGGTAKANSCAGGAGGSGGSGTAAVISGAGGGAGGYGVALISNPSLSYSYSVGTAGTAGTAGTGGYQAGAGSAGYIEVTEYFGYTTTILANSVSSSVVNGARMIWASVKSVCSSNPCTIGAQSGDFTSITRSGTGAYQANFNAGTFSGTPVCTCSTVGSLDGHCSAYNSTTSASTIRAYTPAGASQDGYIEMMCIGPR